MKLTTHFHLVLRLKMHAAMPHASMPTQAYIVRTQLHFLLLYCYF